MLDNFFVKLQNQSKQRHKFAIALIICFALLAKPLSCEAQYYGFGNLGYGVGTSLLYPLSSLFYYGAYGLPYLGMAALGGGLANNQYRNIPYNYNGNYGY